MAGYRKRNGKWEVRIRRNNSKNLSKTFVNKEDAQRWAREQESKLDKGIFEDLTAANNILLKDLISRYIKEVVVNKKSYQSERYKAQKLSKHKIAKLKLIQVTPLVLRDYQQELLKELNPSTVNKYLTLVSVSIKYARQILGIYLPTNPCEFIKRLREPEFKAESTKITLQKKEIRCWKVHFENVDGAKANNSDPKLMVEAFKEFKDKKEKRLGHSMYGKKDNY